MFWRPKVVVLGNGLVAGGAAGVTSVVLFQENN